MTESELIKMDILAFRHAMLITNCYCNTNHIIQNLVGEKGGGGRVSCLFEGMLPKGLIFSTFQ